MGEDGSVQARASADLPVVFGRRLAASEAFKTMFREGMALVEETATYLDGPGRRDSQSLSRQAALTYATESMRLTTRLMQLASWLLLQRAVNDGDLTAEQAGHERSKVKLGGMATAVGGSTWDELPAQLRLLIERSVRLQERVLRLDGALSLAPDDEIAENPVLDAQTLIAGAFARR